MFVPKALFLGIIRMRLWFCFTMYRHGKDYGSKISRAPPFWILWRQCVVVVAIVRKQKVLLCQPRTHALSPFALMSSGTRVLLCETIGQCTDVINIKMAARRKFESDNLFRSVSL